MSVNLLTSVLGWLERGYPEGIPSKDFIPLLEVLHRKLTETEVNEVVQTLIHNEQHGGDGVVSREEIEAAIKQQVLETASDEDIARVASKLAAGGWPLSGLRKVREADGQDAGAEVGA